MDVRAHQTRAKSKTVELVFLFILAVAGTASVLYVPVLCVSGINPNWYHYINNSTGFMWSCVISLSIIGIASVCKAFQLQGGGKAVAYACGARPIKEPPDSREQRLVEIVQQLSVACKVKPPALYIMRNEHGINSFVAGYKESDTALTVTKGALENLTDDELKGVIAHEFAHIVNGDIGISTQLIAIVFGVASVAILGRHLMRFGAYGIVFGLMLICCGLCGGLCAQAIQACVSRQRELLADASAVQFAHTNHGLASALKKISAIKGGSSLSEDNVSFLNHLMLSDCRGSRLDEGWSPTLSTIRRKMVALFDTHPPLSDRIRLLDPTFRGDFR
jgi:Zn-dependent protease with chaperone function